MKATLQPFEAYFAVTNLSKLIFRYLTICGQIFVHSIGNVGIVLCTSIVSGLICVLYIVYGYIVCKSRKIMLVKAHTSVNNIQFTKLPVTTVPSEESLNPATKHCIPNEVLLLFMPPIYYSLGLV